MAKKIIAVFMFSFLVLVLAGCNKKEETQKGQSIDQIKAPRTSQEEPTDEKAKSLPSELTSACEGKSEGDTCEASMPAPKDGKNEDAEEKKMTGTCKKASDGDQLVCFSNDMPSKPEGGLRNK